MSFVIASALYGGGNPVFPCFEKGMYVNNPEELNKNHVLLLHGGGDISPSIYNQQPNDYCHASNTPGLRDQQELEFIKQAIKLDIPIVGICRGAQLICAFDGGYLLQHITGHTSGNHEMHDTETGEQYVTTSCHHQMMMPKQGNKILTECNMPVRGVNDKNEWITIDSVPEIVHFPAIKALGIQGHPEWAPKSKFVEYCSKLIKQYLLKE